MNYRIVSIDTWDDEWFHGASRDEKLVFLYLITNRRTVPAGLYRLPWHVMAVEIPMAESELQETMARLRQAGKVFYDNGIVWVRRMWAYQGNESEKMQTKLRTDLADLPADSVLVAQFCMEYGIDTLSIPYPTRARGDNTIQNKRIQDKKETGRNKPTAVARDKRAPATPTAVAVLGDWFAAEYERTQHTKCIRAFGKDGAGIKRLLAQGLAADYVQQLMTFYLEDHVDSWWEDHGHDLGTFCAQAQIVMTRFEKRASGEERETGYERRAEARAFHAEDLPQATDVDRAAALATIAQVKAAFAARKMPEEAQR